jgi:hypothetical protein
MTRLRTKCGIVIALTLAVSSARADTLELKNGSLIKGKFMGGSQAEIDFQVGSTIQKYNVADIVSLKFNSEGITPGATSTTTPGTATEPPPAAATDTPPSTGSASPSALPDDPGAVAHVEAKPDSVTIPAGTVISVRTVNEIDASQGQAGAPFEASLQEPIVVDGAVIAARDADVWGRVVEAKQSGTFTGRSQLRLELTGIVINGHTVRVVTGEYGVTGKSRGASTARRTIEGAAVGSLIGAVADGGQGAAIGAGAGAAAGAASEIVTGGDQVRVPSETYLEFTLQEDVTIPSRPS